MCCAPRLAEAGRNPDDCKIFYVINPTVALDRSEEAEERVARRAASRKAAPEMALASDGQPDRRIDFAQYDIDALDRRATTNGQQGTLKRLVNQGSTLREIAQNYRFSYEDLIGTPDRIAAQMAEVMEELGGDGFVFQGNLNRRYIAEITDGLAPALQRQGLVRKAYEHARVRDNLFAF